MSSPKVNHFILLSHQRYTPVSSKSLHNILSYIGKTHPCYDDENITSSRGLTVADDTQVIAAGLLWSTSSDWIILCVAAFLPAWRTFTTFFVVTHIRQSFFDFRRTRRQRRGAGGGGQVEAHLNVPYTVILPVDCEEAQGWGRADGAGGGGSSSCCSSSSSCCSSSAGAMGLSGGGRQGGSWKHIQQHSVLPCVYTFMQNKAWWRKKSCSM